MFSLPTGARGLIWRRLRFVNARVSMGAYLRTIPVSGSFPNTAMVSLRIGDAKHLRLWKHWYGGQLSYSRIGSR